MKKLNTALFLGLAFFFYNFTALSQEKWSLDKCVQHAIENNIQIKQQALNTKYNENKAKEAKYDMYPNLNAGMSQDFNFGLSTGSDNVNVSGNSMTFGVSLSSNMTLFNGLVKKNTAKQSKFDLEAALQDLQKAKDDISLNVASAYLDILFNKELVATTLEQLEVTNQQIEYNKKQVEAGNLAKGKIFETEAQAANEELTLTNYENQLQISILNLAQLLELKEVNGFDIHIPEIDIDALTLELASSNAVFAKAVLERPEIKSKELKLKSSEIGQDIAKGYMMPSLSLGASIGDSYTNLFEVDNASLGDQLNDHLRTSVGLSLRIPIFNGYSARLGHQNSKLNFENSKHELQLEKNNLLKQIQQVHANAVAAMKQYEASKKAVTSAKEAFRYVEEKFNLGIVTPLEYNDSKNKVTNAQSSFIQAKYEYIFRVKILDFYNGKPITL